MVKFDFDTYQDVIIDDYNLDKVKEVFLDDNKMTGWYQLDDNNIDDIISTANYVRDNCDVFLVIGIGGSYLGAKAVIDAMSTYFQSNNPEIIFCGNSLSSDYLTNLLKYIKDKDIIINIISKSGTTLEPMISFDILLDYMEDKYGKDNFNRRVIITTDENNSPLNSLAKINHYKLFTIPADIGGRFSVLTAAGLLPIAVADIDIEKLFDGASSAKYDLDDCYYYTVLRHLMYKKGKIVESFNVYEPKLYCFMEWLKQLFAESQGKKNRGLLPVSTINSRDLHSLGQYYQEGPKILFETTIFASANEDIYISKYSKTLNQINHIAMQSVALAHHKANISSTIIELDEINETNLGYLIFFFEMSAMLGSYLLGVRYYDQPGVNAYKKILSDAINPMLN